MNSLTDFFRGVIYTQGIFVGAITVLVIVWYVFFYHGSRTLLYWHIILISISYATLTSYVLIDIYHYTGSELAWRTPTALSGFVMGDVALCFILARLAFARAHEMGKQQVEQIQHEEMEGLRRDMEYYRARAHRLADEANSYKLRLQLLEDDEKGKIR